MAMPLSAGFFSSPGESSGAGFGFSALTAEPSAVGNNFYTALTEGKPQVSIPIVHKQSVDVSKPTNLEQNALSGTSQLRSQINQTKHAFLETMKDAKMEAGQAIMDAAKANSMNPGHVAMALFPQKPCEAVNFMLACDPTCIGTIWSAVSNVSAQCSNADLDRVLTQALKTLHDAGKSQEGKAPKAAVSWDKFNKDDLKRFAAADPLKDDHTGKQIAAVEQIVIEQERNQKNLEANYTSTGDVYEKVNKELDRAIVDKELVAALIGPDKKDAAECLMRGDSIREITKLKITPAKNDDPLKPFDGVEELKRKIEEAKPESPAPMLEKLTSSLGGFNPFRRAA